MGLLVLFCYVIFAFVVVIVVSERDAGCQCGIEASSNPIHHNPWLVLLEFYRRGYLTEYRCGGTLVGRSHVVTAAHCIKKIKHHRMKIRLGEYDLSSKVDCSDGVCADRVIHADVAEVIVHPGYDEREHDIAILRLSEETPCTDFIRPACLPTKKGYADAIFNAAGWGEDVSTGRYSDIKKSIHLPAWSHNQCRTVYKHDVVPNHAICAGGLKGVDTCRGDSGGPLTLKKKYYVELFGVTSVGPATCGREGAPGIYTSVVDHLEWIQEVIAAI